MALYNLDVNDVPPSERVVFEAIPAGEYLLQVIGSEMRDTKAGTGKYLKLIFQVLEGPHADRQIFDNLNVKNQSEETEKIARRSLADLCLALGIGHLRDTEELHFKPFRATVNVRADKNGQYPPSNGVKYWTAKSIHGSPTTQPRQQQSAPPLPPPPQQRPANGGPKPWQQKRV
jgi:hypothetical protein